MLVAINQVLVQMNLYTFRGCNSVIFSFSSILNWDLLFTDRICSCRSKFCLLRVDLIFEAFLSLGKQAGSHKTCGPLEKKGLKNMALYTLTTICISCKICYIVNKKLAFKT